MNDNKIIENHTQ